MAFTASLVLWLVLAASVWTASAAIRHSQVGARSAGTPVPADFVGMTVDGPLFASGDGLSLAGQFAEMARIGVGTVRVVFSWADAQPYQNWSDVPANQTSGFVDVGGVPTSFAATDQVASMAALYGLRLLPVVLFAPSWDAGLNPGGVPPPARVAPYADYLKALIGRYGPRGSYWQIYSPRLPIRQWQIWNEPNIPFYWGQPSVSGYVQLLRAAHAAIVSADPNAQTVLGAITNRSWDYLARIYRVPGARSLFDVAALNPFSATPAHVLDILQRVRRTMNAFHDRGKPMIATEVSWTSAHGVPGAHFDWDKTAALQARDIAAVLPMLAAQRSRLRLRSFFYYTWIGDESHPTSDWSFAGLLRVVAGQAVPKPAFTAFTRGVRALRR